MVAGLIPEQAEFVNADLHEAAHLQQVRDLSSGETPARHPSGWRRCWTLLRRPDQRASGLPGQCVRPELSSRPTTARRQWPARR
ncbi:hypothetical protein CAP37_07190 [Hydrogenophaga sp. IBVHS1]|nr:hypothetical protein CAP37_07190 [Hydrogenophaga sp. IBVHS1]